MTADGRRAVSASGDHTLKVWDLETGSALRTLEGHTRGVKGVAVTAGGRHAVSASEHQTLKVWDLETGTVVATFTCEAAALCCAWASPRVIVAGDKAGQVHFLSLESGDGCSVRCYLGYIFPPLEVGFGRCGRRRGGCWGSCWVLVAGFWRTCCGLY